MASTPQLPRLELCVDLFQRQKKKKKCTNVLEARLRRRPGRKGGALYCICFLLRLVMEENDPGMIGDIVFHLRTQFIIGPGRHAVCLLRYKSWATGLLRESGNRVSQKQECKLMTPQIWRAQGTFQGWEVGCLGVLALRFTHSNSSRNNSLESLF